MKTLSSDGRGGGKKGKGDEVDEMWGVVEVGEDFQDGVTI